MIRFLKDTSARALAAIVAWVVVVQLALYAIYIPLEGKLVDRYHGADAARDFAAVNARIDQLTHNCNRLKEEEKNGNN
jgi:hypothetical protein